MHNAFIDLDELIIACRDKSARKFIQEAVDCYRVGAYRSCIVATWNAVVFDFIHKLKELDQLGDRNAAELIQSFDNMRQASDVKKLWEFESKIPERALREFELLSPIEEEDLKRLLKDRNRCAHPSMASLEEPFEATAELARYHMRSAVTHLLQRPPIQGRAALDRIWEDIRSSYFPSDPSEAAQYFRKGPLACARFSLIQSIILGLTISLLTVDYSRDERDRQFSALNAVAIMYRSEFGEILSEKLSSIILEKVTDENWHKVISYLFNVSASEYLNNPCRLKAIVFIQKMDVQKGISPQNKTTLTYASSITFLIDAVRLKLSEAPPDEVLELQEQMHSDIHAYLQEILKEGIQNYINEFASSSCFDMANNYAAKIIKVAAFTTIEQRKCILKAFCENDQIYASFSAVKTIRSIFDEETKENLPLGEHWIYFRDQIDEISLPKLEDLKRDIDSYKPLNI